MGRKRKVKPPVVAPCQLCQYFFHSKLLKNDQIHNPRLCASENREILSIDPACEEFILTKFFFCDRTNHQISIGTCHRRKSNGTPECRRCKQFEELLAAEALVGVAVPETKPSPLKVRSISTMVEEEEEPIQKKIILKKRSHATIWEKPQWND